MYAGLEAARQNMAAPALKSAEGGLSQFKSETVAWIAEAAARQQELEVLPAGPLLEQAALMAADEKIFQLELRINECGQQAWPLLALGLCVI